MSLSTSTVGTENTISQTEAHVSPTTFELVKSNTVLKLTTEVRLIVPSSETSVMSSSFKKDTQMSIRATSSTSLTVLSITEHIVSSSNDIQLSTDARGSNPPSLTPTVGPQVLSSVVTFLSTTATQSTNGKIAMTLKVTLSGFGISCGILLLATCVLLTVIIVLLWRKKKARAALSDMQENHTPGTHLTWSIELSATQEKEEYKSSNHKSETPVDEQLYENTDQLYENVDHLYDTVDAAISTKLPFEMKRSMSAPKQEGRNQHPLMLEAPSSMQKNVCYGTLNNVQAPANQYEYIKY